MVKIAIVYHSGYGHTEQQAKYVEKGVASVEGAEVDLIKAKDVTEDPFSLNKYDGIIFGTPTYMGAASAEFKAFAEASSKVWFKQDWKDKIAAGFTNSHGMSGDKFNTLIQLFTLAAQHSMIWVSLGVWDESSPEGVISGDPEKVNRLGAYSGAMAQSNTAPPSETPPIGDLKTAELLGKRVAEATIRWNK